MRTPRFVLEQECRTFTRYLVGQRPTPYVVEKYCDAHAISLNGDSDLFDARLTAVARWHPETACIADAYARFFAPRGMLRKKLVLLLAILEISPPFFREFDQPLGGGRIAQVLGFGVRLLKFVLALVVGIIGFLPLRLVTPGQKGVER
jgi:hypothetical protein